MKIDAKDLKKVTELLAKEVVLTIAIDIPAHERYISFKFTDDSGHDVEVKIHQADSGSFSKILRETRF